MGRFIIVVGAEMGVVGFAFGVRRGLVYTVALMTTRFSTSRTTVLLAGPALIAVLAILAGSPVWTASTGASRLSVASLVALTSEVCPVVDRTSTDRPARPVALRAPTRSIAAHTDRHRIGLLRLVLPPPTV
jgi:hypothetical protein